MAFAGVLYGVGDIRYEEVKISEINEREVLIAVKCAGICGSDIPRIKTKGTYSFPTIPGHELAGVVSEIGSNVTNVAINDRVTVYPLLSCGQCIYCKEGKDNLCDNYNYLGSRCDGGFAEFIKCPAENVLKIPDNISFEEAALVEPMAVALRGVKRGKIKLGDTVVVFGLGPIGLFAAKWAKINSASTVVGVDRNNYKLKLAKEMGGVDYAINLENKHCDSIVEKVIESEAADIVLECSGANVFQELAVGVVKKSGLISMVGNPKGDVLFKEKNFQKILRKEIILVGSWNSLIVSEENEWRETLENLASGKIRASPVISHRFKLSEIKEVFDYLHEKKYKNYCKGVFLME
ncbi:MAG: galactitol-1-phosphate 5-dehydrogenase [Nanoarchaeota archaeon]